MRISIREEVKEDDVGAVEGEVSSMGRGSRGT